MFTPEIPSIFTAFFAGFLTFLSPCIFPLLPGYISFMSGESLENLKNGTAGENQGKYSPRFKAFLGALFFGLGFTIVFVALGATATSFGQFLKSYQMILSQIAGVIVIIFGLHMIGVFKIKFLMKTTKMDYKKKSVPFFINAFFLGIAFVLGWTPCVGPILAGILAVASQESSVTQGMMLLFIYSLGLWIPFLVAALAVNEVINAIRKAGKYLVWVERIAGVLLVLIGVLLLTNKMYALSIWFTEVFSFLPVVG
ncbi:MAG: cytochrome c biogenesis protein CcdA [Mucispirillum sp.]|nr:cytochrome c biogenesis protein CcdA [Mucispirillum sp.]